MVTEGHEPGTTGERVGRDTAMKKKESGKEAQKKILRLQPWQHNKIYTKQKLQDQGSK